MMIEISRLNNEETLIWFSKLWIIYLQNEIKSKLNIINLIFYCFEFFIGEENTSKKIFFKKKINF